MNIPGLMNQGSAQAAAGMGGQGNLSPEMMQQGQDIWAMLDEMAENDPEAYAKFMAETLKPENAPTPTDREEITPEPCFVVKSQNSIGKKIFINVMSHPKVSPPREVKPDTPEMKAELERSGAAQMVYPLSLNGPFADTDRAGSACHVYDIAINPLSLKMASDDINQRDTIVEMAFQWIEEKHSEQIVRRNLRFPKLKYKGDKTKIRTMFIRKGPPQQQPPPGAAAASSSKGPKIVATESEAAKASGAAPVITEVSSSKTGGKKKKKAAPGKSKASSKIEVVETDKKGASSTQAPAKLTSANEVKPSLVMDLLNNAHDPDGPKPEASVAGLPSHIIFTIETPLDMPQGVTVSVGDDSVLFHSPGVYRAVVDTPFLVTSEGAKAEWNKVQGKVIIAVPVAGKLTPPSR